MEELRRRMKGGGAASGKHRAATELESRSKRELYDLAKDLDIEGRSKMTKQELVRAIRPSA
jgi:hypothetical protein